MLVGTLCATEHSLVTLAQVDVDLFENQTFSPEGLQLVEEKGRALASLLEVRFESMAAEMAEAAIACVLRAAS